CALWYSNHWVF
nr:immunoglobulin light chain junction region [Mus musculus]NSM03060.1 immunoglobulin light chain junction region [Mus musculus]NSM03062.1 immunoglobulin light chain junction region [Mus musculus]NSM03064.1 immunoglobulin light chain junction region [Mus musculus]NSM03065.1 immunoglobulin light chain junction region [Mus musculus]